MPGKKIDEEKGQNMGTAEVRQALDPCTQYEVEPPVQPVCKAFPRLPPSSETIPGPHQPLNPDVVA